jgi:hypothetical protein
VNTPGRRLCAMRLAVRYVRYALATLAGVGFGTNLN